MAFLDTADRALTDAGFVLMGPGGEVVSTVPDGNGTGAVAGYVAWRKRGSVGAPPGHVDVIRRSIPGARGEGPSTLELIQLRGGKGWAEVSDDALAAARSTLCHDLNNPLAAVFGSTDLMLLMGVSRDVRREVERIISQAERMTEVVRRFASGGEAVPGGRLKAPSESRAGRGGSKKNASGSS